MDSYPGIAKNSEVPPKGSFGCCKLAHRGGGSEQVKIPVRKAKGYIGIKSSQEKESIL